MFNFLSSVLNLFKSPAKPADVSSERPASQPVANTAVTATAATGNTLFTNAPEHRGDISGDFHQDNLKRMNNWNEKQLVSSAKKQLFMLDSLLLMGMINDVMTRLSGEKQQVNFADALTECKDRYACSMCIQKLFAQGIVKINGVVIADFERYGVILLTEPTPMDYINDLRALFVEDGYKDLIYFAVVDPLLVTQPKKLKFELLDKQSFKYDATKQGVQHRKYEEYAMWWQGENDTDFETSGARKNIESSLDLLENYNSYAAGMMSYAFGRTEEYTRTRLPQQDVITIQGPENVEILFSLSASKGMYFHFPALPKYERYRDNFLKAFVDFCYDMRREIIENDLPADDFGEPSPLVWFRHLTEEVKKNYGKNLAVGVYKQDHWQSFSLN
jgi:hypothetical protein